MRLSLHTSAGWPCASVAMRVDEPPSGLVACRDFTGGISVQEHES